MVAVHFFSFHFRLKTQFSLSGVSGHTEEQDETEFSVLNRPPLDLHETELAVKHGITHEVAKGVCHRLQTFTQRETFN